MELLSLKMYEILQSNSTISLVYKLFLKTFIKQAQLWSLEDSRVEKPQSIAELWSIQVSAWGQ